MRVITLLLLLATPALAQVAQMPNAVKVCDEGGTITASSATAPVTVQFGKGTAWNTPVVLGADVLPLYVYYTTPILGGDPAENVVKELDVQQQATAYTVTCKAVDGTSTVVSIPALPPPTITVPVAVDLLSSAASGGLPMGCRMQLATSKDSQGKAVREYLVIICDNPPKDVAPTPVIASPVAN